MATCLDYGIDYPHKAVHCPACFENEQQQDHTQTMDRLVDNLATLTEKMIALIGDTPQPRQYYRQPQPEPQQQPSKGGVNVQPIRRDNPNRL